MTAVELEEITWGEVRAGDTIVAVDKREWRVTAVGDVVDKLKPIVLERPDEPVTNGTPPVSAKVKVHKRLNAGDVAKATGHPVDAVAAEIVREYFPEAFATRPQCECGAVISDEMLHADWHGEQRRLEGRVRDLEILAVRLVDGVA